MELKATLLSPTVIVRFFLSISLLAPVSLFSQAGHPVSSAPEKDVLIFADGERLIGQLQRSTGNNVMFKSDMAGLVTVTWDKIQELHSSQHFAVVEKGVKLKTNESDAKIPQGTISMAGSSLTVVQPAGPPILLPLASTADVIDMQTFSHVVLSRPAWYQNWKGSATVGVTFVKATQRSQTYTSAVNLSRDIPGEPWMDAESRTTLNFTSSYGQLDQPNTPQIKTSIFHAQAERDRYFSPRLFIFANAAFEHDYSQGLDLQQTYSGGVGWSAIKGKNEQLDLRSALGYEDQKFIDPVQNQHLFGSIFSENYNRTFPKKAMLHEDISIMPSWSNLHAYSVTGNLSLTMPIVKRIAFTVGVADSFLNNPSPNFRKNSFQFTSGVTYTQP